MKGLLSFGFPFFLKVIIPGLAGAITLIPLIASIGVKIGVNSGFLEKSLLNGLFFIGLVLCTGLIISFLDDTIYKLYEGYLLWPKCVSNFFKNRLNNKIKDKMKKVKGEDKIKRQMLWDWLLRFPLKKKRNKTETEAVLPTKLGNILYSYENYPLSRYGIIATFYWPRLWLALDTETRKEINTMWAEADCVTYTSFVLVFSSILYILLSIFDYFNIPTLLFGPFGKPIKSLALGNIAFTPIFFLLMGSAMLFIAWLLYILSLPLHISNGNLFKSLFDLHRNKLEPMLLEKGTGGDSWQKTLEYLRHGLIQCDNCSKLFPDSKEECPSCKQKTKHFLMLKKAE